LPVILPHTAAYRQNIESVLDEQQERIEGSYRGLLDFHFALGEVPGLEFHTEW
jgi:hypothetical protein